MNTLLMFVSSYTKSCNVTESNMQVTSTPTSLANQFSVLFPKIWAVGLSHHMLAARILAFTMFKRKK